MNQKDYKEIKESFKKHYPAEYKDVFINKKKVDIKYSSTKWHSFKIGYSIAKGWFK